MNGVEFIVYGTPAPQGSKKPMGLRRTKSGKQVSILVESSKLVKPWREAVMLAWYELRNTGRVQGIMGPVNVEIVFYLHKVKNPKHPLWPVSRRDGDIDKLRRATYDALTKAGAIEDDCFVVLESGGKVYAGSLPYGLQQPGATIKIRRAG